MKTVCAKEYFQFFTKHRVAAINAKRHRQRARCIHVKLSFYSHTAINMGLQQKISASDTDGKHLNEI